MLDSLQGSLCAVEPLAIIIAYGEVFPARPLHKYSGRHLSSKLTFVSLLNFLNCFLDECNCKKHEVCYPDEGRCKCKKPYKKTKEGHCVSPFGKLCMVIRSLRNEDGDAKEDRWIYILLLNFTII